MGKINGENLWGKLRVLFNIANLLKKIPISSDQGNENKIFWDFQWYFFP